MSKLPDKPSELIRLALADLRKCEADPAYAVDMDVWHEPARDMPCSVGMAGAVIAQSLGAHILLDIGPQDFDCDTRRKLRSLDHFADGLVGGGLIAAGIREDTWRGIDLYRDIVRYDWSAENFYKGMANLADDLEKAGL